MLTARALTATILLSAAPACGVGTAPPSEATALPAGAVAACAGYPFSAELIAGVAASQGITPTEAARRLVAEARLARAADRRGLQSTAAFRVAEQAILARAMLSSIKGAAAAADPTPAELDRVRAAHWADLDHPVLARVLHAIAIAPPGDANREKAREIAAAMTEATRTATTDAEFASLARSVPHDGVDIHVEALDPVAPDGRAPSGATFDLDFTAAAHRLTTVNEQIGPVGSKYGFHVIRLLERIPARRVSDDELRASARAEIVAIRAHEATRKIIDEGRAKSSPVIERSIEDAMHALDAAPARP